MTALHPDPLHAALDALFADTADRPAPGCVLGVLREGEPSWMRAYGLASLELGVPLRADSRLRIASVSKQFTVAAALLLERQGRLSQQDDIRRHLPELPELPQVVRVGHLMRNTSGLPDMLELLRLGGVGLDQRVDREQLLQALVRNRHLNFAPGSRFLYCNSGFALLGLITERLSGRSLDAQLREAFFDPLGMQSTRMVVESDLPLPGLATPYLGHGPGQWRRAQHGFEHGGEGGLVSCLGDLLRWAAHLMRPVDGVPDLSAALAARQPLSEGGMSPYAHGLEHGTLDGMATLGHGGLWPGFRTEFLLLPAQRLAIVVISNDGMLNPYKKAREVARLLLDRPTPIPTAGPGAAEAEAEVEALSGEWLDAQAGELLTLSTAGSGAPLMAQQWGTPFELQQQTDARWLPLRGAYEFEIPAPALDEQGRLRLRLGAGREARLQRLAQRPELPTGLDGVFCNRDAGPRWQIQGSQLQVEGPLLKPARAWTLRGLSEDLVELQSPGYWMQGSQLLRLQRDAAGRICGFSLDSARIKGLLFQRCG